MQHAPDLHILRAQTFQAKVRIVAKQPRCMYIGVLSCTMASEQRREAGKKWIKRD